MKRHLILTLTAALVLLAAAAFAQNFHPIADADFIGYPDTDLSFGSQPALDQPGPWSDSEWGPMELTADDASVLVAASFHPIADADFLGRAATPNLAGAGGDAHCATACGQAGAKGCAR